MRKFKSFDYCDKYVIFIEISLYICWIFDIESANNETDDDDNNSDDDDNDDDSNSDDDDDDND